MSSFLSLQNRKRVSYMTSKKTSFEDSPSPSELSNFGNFIINSNSLQLPSQLNRIVFNYFGGATYNLYNKDLRLRNDSNSNRIHFKIKSNNPQHYVVHPTEAIIEPHKNLEIVIQLVIDYEDSEWIGSKYFSKFQTDKFKLTWKIVKKHQEKQLASNLQLGMALTNQVSFKQEFSKIFKVHVEHKQTKTEDEIEHLMVKKPYELDDIAKKTLEQHKNQLKNLEVKIDEIEAEKVSEGCLNKYIIIFFCLISFSFGVFFSK